MISAAIAKTPSRPSTKPYINSKSACSTNYFEPAFSEAASRALSPSTLPLSSTFALAPREQKSIRRIYEIENREREPYGCSCAPTGWL